MAGEAAMEVIVTPLGTRGWMPQTGRQTMCTLVQMGATNFLLDCGTGASRLLEPEIQRLLGDGPLTILFSHYHLDHTAGLVYLPGLFNGSKRRVRLAGPRAGFTQEGLREACECLTSSPLSSLNYSDFPFPLELQEFGPEGLVIDGITITASHQDHPGGSVSLRIEDAVCYATDLSPFMAIDPAIAQGIEVLIHETWLRESQVGPHSGLMEALDRARKARVARFIPIHFAPQMTEAEIQQIAAFSTPSLPVIIPEEGRPIRFFTAD